MSRLLCTLLAALLLLVGAPAPAQDSALPSTLVVSFQKQKDPRQIRAAADEVALFLTGKLGLPVEVVVPTSYGATVQAMISNKAHVAYMDSLPFVLADAEAPVEILLVEEREGRTDYDSLMVVAKGSPVATLADLRGKRMMFTSPTSTSGYVYARSRLVSEGLLKPGEDPATFFSSVNYAGGYDRALLAVLNGQADVCAVSDYTMEGKKASVYLTDEQRAQLRVISETPGVPTHLIAARGDLPAEFRAKIKAALIALSAERPELLADVYGAATLVEPKGDHVARTRLALEHTGLEIKSLVKP